MKTRLILAAALVLQLSTHAQTATAPTPLSFADGRVVFGIEDQTRFEYRDNNFDFNSGLRTINDDSWLHRLQLRPRR